MYVVFHKSAYKYNNNNLETDSMPPDVDLTALPVECLNSRHHLELGQPYRMALLPSIILSSLKKYLILFVNTYI